MVDPLPVGRWRVEMNRDPDRADAGAWENLAELEVDDETTGRSRVASILRGVMCVPSLRPAEGDVVRVWQGGAQGERVGQFLVWLRTCERADAAALLPLVEGERVGQFLVRHPAAEGLDAVELLPPVEGEADWSVWLAGLSLVERVRLAHEVGVPPATYLAAVAACVASEAFDVSPEERFSVAAILRRCVRFGRETEADAPGEEEPGESLDALRAQQVRWAGDGAALNCSHAPPSCQITSECALRAAAYHLLDAQRELRGPGYMGKDLGLLIHAVRILELLGRFRELEPVSFRYVETPRAPSPPRPPLGDVLARGLSTRTLLAHAAALHHGTLARGREDVERVVRAASGYFVDHRHRALGLLLGRLPPEAHTLELLHGLDRCGMVGRLRTKLPFWPALEKDILDRHGLASFEPIG